MSALEWFVVKAVWCEHVGQEAHLLEQRVYPAEMLPEAVGYRVRARRCDWGISCNLAGFACRWAFTRPELDPFEFA